MSYSYSSLNVAFAESIILTLSMLNVTYWRHVRDVYTVPEQNQEINSLNVHNFNIYVYQNNIIL